MKKCIPPKKARGNSKIGGTSSTLVTKQGLHVHQSSFCQYNINCYSFQPRYLFAYKVITTFTKKHTMNYNVKNLAIKTEVQTSLSYSSPWKGREYIFYNFWLTD